MLKRQIGRMRATRRGGRGCADDGVVGPRPPLELPAGVRVELLVRMCKALALVRGHLVDREPARIGLIGADRAAIPCVGGADSHPTRSCPYSCVEAGFLGAEKRRGNLEVATPERTP